MSISVAQVFTITWWDWTDEESLLGEGLQEPSKKENAKSKRGRNL